MEDEHPIQLSKWYGLLIFAAGNVLTGIAARVAPYDHGNPLLTMILVYWMLFGLVAGAWIIRGQRWRSLAHDARQRLGLAYLAVGWAGAVRADDGFVRGQPGHHCPRHCADYCVRRVRG